MATDTVLISHVTGKAWMRTAEGQLIALHEGMRVPVNANILTDEGSSVILQVNGVPAVILGQNTDMLVTEDLAQAQPQPAEHAVAAPADSVADQVLAALDAGQDPFAVLDPTAAVLTGGGGGGSSFTRLASDIEVTTPLALSYPRLGVETPEFVLLGGAVPAADEVAAVAPESTPDLGSNPNPDPNPDPDPNPNPDPNPDPDPDPNPVEITLSINGGGVVSESGLTGGTQAGDSSVLTTKGDLGVTGVDRVDQVEVRLPGGDWLLVSTGVPVDIGHGSITFTQADDGSWTWSYTLKSNSLDHEAGKTGASDQVADLFEVRVSDGAGNYSNETGLEVEINDDGPVFTLVNDANGNGMVEISVDNPTASGHVYEGQFADWVYGADKFKAVTASMEASNGKSVEVESFSEDGSQIVLLLKNGDQTVGKLTLNANGTDSLEVFHREGAVLSTKGGMADPGKPTSHIDVDLGNIVDAVVSAPAGVNGNAQGWGIDNGNINTGEALRFTFVDGANHSVGYGVEGFTFHVTQFTGGPGSDPRDIFVKVFLNESMTEYDVFKVARAQDGSISLSDKDLDWSVSGGNTHYVAGDSIYGFEVINDSDKGGFRVNDVGADYKATPPDLDFSGIQITITDGDGDTATQDLNIHLGGKTGDHLGLEAIVGTASADTLIGTEGNDVLVVGHGNEALTGGAGDDVFMWKLGDQGATTPVVSHHVTDFGVGGGDTLGKDTLDLSDLLQGHGHGGAPGDHNDLTQYLSISGGGGQTVIDVKVNADGTAADHVTQQIVIDNVDLTQGHGSDSQAQLINNLINEGKLKVDPN